ncbi:MAG TPA: hypothetical protein VFH38_11840 [Jatrophihabitans sp.]|nr:hypothetical protein [Jatrophihabitans sp.]
MRRLLVLLAALATLVTSGAAVAAAGPAGAAGPSAAQLHRTAKIVVRPVYDNGTPVAGWKVVKQKIPGFTCDSGPSYVAVDPNIRYCGFSATYTVACWKSTHHTVLCMRDPRVHKLARIRYTGSFGNVKAPAHPSPQALGLFGKGYCLVRDGGAWGSVKGHPRWNGTYSCGRGSLYGPGRDGIDRSVNPWRVHLVLNLNRPTIRERRVATAYYAGTAHYVR